MGTSSKYPGLEASRLRSAIKAGKQASTLVSGEPSKGGRPQCVADAVLHELTDPEAAPDEPLQPLVAIGAAAADRFTTVVSEILGGNRPIPETPGALAEFVDDVTGPGDSIADSIVRRAAVTSARRLEEEASARRSRGEALGDEFFCLLYRHFHADVLTEFVLASVVEATVPGATLLSNTAIGE